MIKLIANKQIKEEINLPDNFEMCLSYSNFGIQCDTCFRNINKYTYDKNISFYWIGDAGDKIFPFINFSSAKKCKARIVSSPFKRKTKR